MSGLEKTQVPVTFDAVDTKTAEQLLAPGKFLSLINCIRRKTGKIEKRYGTETLGNSILGGSTPLNGRLIDKYNDDTIVLDSQNLYSYSAANDALIDRGNITSATLTGTQVVRNSARQAMSDAAFGNGKIVYVWQDSRATAPAEAIRYSIFDDTSGAALVNDVELSADGLSPRVVALMTGFAVFYIEGASLKFRFIDYATPTAIGSEVTVDTVSGLLFDAITYDSSVALITYLTAADTYKISYVLSTGALGNGSNGRAAPVTSTVASNITALSIAADSSTATLFLVYAHATKVILDGYNSAALAAKHSVDIETIASIRNITTIPTTASTAAVYYEQGIPASVAVAKNQTVRNATVNYSPSASTVTVAAAYFKGSVGLGAKGFYDGSDVYSVLTYESALQSSFFIARSDGFLMARVAAGIGGGLTREAQPGTVPNPSTLQTGLPSVFIDSNSEYSFPTTIRSKFQSTLEGEIYSSAQGLQKSSIALDHSEYVAETLGGSYHLAGGILYAYDGNSPTEQGFLVYPEDVSISTYTQEFAPADVNTGTDVITVPGSAFSNGDVIRFTSTAGLPAPLGASTSYYVINVSSDSFKVSLTFGGSAVNLTTQGTGVHTVYLYGSDLAAGTYYYGVIYEWVDGQGQVHRSAPAFTNVTSLSNGQLFTIHYPNLRLTAKDGITRADVKVVLYRGLTSGDSEVLYRLKDQDNDPTAASGTMTDTGGFLVPTDVLAVQEVLYTTGGVIENIVAPSSACITGYRNRLFLGGLEDGNTLAYSKYAVPGEGVAFSDIFTLRCDPRGGPIKALFPLDDKLVVFKKDAIFTLVGDGPLDTGAQNDYSEPQLVSSDLGCAYPRSIALIPNGLIFKSDKGIYLLDRNLGTSYIGAGIERFNSSTITSAVVMEDHNEVRFTTSDDICLVFNYFFGQWSWFENYGYASAVGGSSGYYLLTDEGVIRKEVEGVYNDSGATYAMQIETGWISLAGVQGYQRLYQIMGLGDFYSDHYTKIKTAYDFEAAYTETIYFNVANGLILSYYGDDPAYGSSSPYGGTGSSVYQWSLQPRRQKCQSIKLLISDVDTKTEAGGASFSFVSLNLIAGVKPNGPKLGFRKQIGSL